MRTLLHDLREGTRSLRKHPRLLIVASLTLALGIGAVTSIFSVVNGVLLTPLPYPQPDRLANVWSSAPGVGYDQFPLSPDLYLFTGATTPCSTTWRSTRAPASTSPSRVRPRWWTPASPRTVTSPRWASRSRTDRDWTGRGGARRVGPHPVPGRFALRDPAAGSDDVRRHVGAAVRGRPHRIVPPGAQRGSRESDRSDAGRVIQLRFRLWVGAC